MQKEQRTVKHVVSCLGIGIHSGKMVSLSIYPAIANSGIVFVRTDIHGTENRIFARYNSVNKTTLGTTVHNEAGIEIATIEHLMAALYGCGIDNAIVEIDGPEIPAMDGSAWPFVRMLECAGATPQAAGRKYLQVLKEVFIQDGESSIKIAPKNSFKATAQISFPFKTIAFQECAFSNKQSFKTYLSKARTFGFKSDAERLKKAGLARGASLENVIVIDDDKIINQEKLRYNNEFARHKLLDLIGDFYLAGSPIMGEITAVKPGHTINNKALRALMQDQSAYRFVEA